MQYATAIPKETGNGKKYQKKAGEKGFTLVEVMTVVGIVAILASIAIPLYLNYKKKAIEKAADATLHQFTTMIPEYQTQHAHMCPDCNKTGTYEYKGESEIRAVFPDFKYNQSDYYDYKVKFTVACTNGQCDESATYTATRKDDSSGLKEKIDHTL